MRRALCGLGRDGARACAKITFQVAWNRSFSAGPGLWCRTPARAFVDPVAIAHAGPGRLRRAVRSADSAESAQALVSAAMNVARGGGDGKVPSQELQQALADAVASTARERKPVPLPLLHKAHSLGLITPPVLSAAVSACTRWREARDLLPLFPIDGDGPLHASLQRSLLLLARLARSHGKHDAAVRIAVRAASGLQQPPWEATMCAGILAAGDARDWPSVRRVFAALAAAGSLPGGATYAALIRSASLCGRDGDARALYREAGEKGLHTAPKVLVAAAAAASATSEPDEATVRLLDEVWQLALSDVPRGPRRDLITRHVANGMLMCKQPARVLAVVETWRRSTAAEEANARALPSLVPEGGGDAVGDGWGASLAEGSERSLPGGADSAPAPALTAHQALTFALQAHALNEDWPSAARLYQSALARGVRPGVSGLAALLTVLEGSGQASLADRAFEEAVGAGVVASGDVAKGGLVDLHGSTPAVARCVVRNVLRKLLVRAEKMEADGAGKNMSGGLAACVSAAAPLSAAPRAQPPPSPTAHWQR